MANDEQYYIINSDRKAEIHIGYEAYKALSEPLRKEVKSYFLFSRNKGAWISKGLYDSYTVTDIVKKLNLPLKGKEQRKTFAEKQQSKVSNAERNIERYENKSDRAIKKAESLQAEFNKLRGDWSWVTQPIIRGHARSEAFGRQRQRVVDRYTKGFAEYEKSDYYKDKATNAKYTAENIKLKNPAYLSNKIKEANTTIKKVTVWVTKYQEPEVYKKLSAERGADIINDRIEKGIEYLQEAYEKLAFYSYHLDQLKTVSNVKVYDQNTLKNAEYALIRGSWMKIIRLNPTTVTHSWFVGSFKHPYSEVRDAVFKGENFIVKPGRIDGHFEIEKIAGKKQDPIPPKKAVLPGKSIYSNKKITFALGEKVVVNYGSGLKHEGSILKLDSGYPLYSKDYVKITGIGDPVLKTMVSRATTRKPLSAKQKAVLSKGQELMKQAQQAQKQSGQKTLTMYNMPMQLALQFASGKKK